TQTSGLGPAPATVQQPPNAVVHVGHAAQIPSLPGMPPIPQMLPGVSVHVQNIVAPAPTYGPMVPYSPHPYAAPVAPAPAAVGAERSQGVVAMMREDAALKAMEAVSRRGPARVLAYSVGAIMIGTM